MITGGNQPYFLPYIGFWQLIKAVDLYEICDDYYFINPGWINRNRILINGAPGFFHLEVQHASVTKRIDELELVDINVSKKLKQIQCAYGKAPYYKEGREIVEKIFTCPEKNLAKFLIASIQTVCDYLGIQTQMILSSGYERDRTLKRENSIYDCCRILGADTYYNAIGGQALYSFEEFRKNGIKLAFIKMDDIKYRQFYGQEFVPNLSILDAIMFNSREEVQDMMNQYTLIEE